MSEPIIFTPGQTVAPPDWNALLLQHGNLQSSQPIPLNDPSVQALIAANPDLVTTLQQHPIYRYYMADGSYVEAFGQENGQDVQIVSYHPSAKFTAAQTAAQTSTTPAGKRTAREEAEIAANAALPADQDPRSETNAERAARADARIKQQGADAEAARVRERQARIDEQNAATAAATSRRADSAEARQVEEAKRPDTKTEFRTVGGQQYLVSVTTPKDGSAPSIRYFGPDGKPIDRIPSEGAATAGTRKLPDLVNQVAAAGLVQVWEGLQADPTLTPAQRATAFQEAYQIAQLAQTNANNEELHRQSERNAASNEAKYRLDYQQHGLGQALDFVNGIIKSGSGSQAGGAAFAAIMGLQLLQMQASGINDLGNGQKAAPLPVVPPAALTNKDAAQAAGQAVSSHIDNALGLGAIGAVTAPGGPARVDPIFKPPPPVVGPVGPTTLAQNAGAGPGEPPARGATPAAASPAAPPPTAGEPGGPPITNDYPVLATPPTAGAAPAPAPAPVAGKPAADPSIGAEPMPNPGGAVLPQPAPVAAQSTDQSPPAQAAEEMVTVRSITGQTMTVPRSVWEAPWTPSKRPAWPVWQEVPQAPAASPGPSPAPAYTYPPPADPSLLQPGAPIQVPGEPPGISVPYPDSAGAESKILPPGQDYAVLGGRPPGDLHAQAASTPPWRMTPSEYQQYVAAGVPQATIWGVPGTGSAA